MTDKFVEAQLVPLIESTTSLRASQYFHAWLKQLFKQVGGPEAKTNTELTALIDKAAEDIVQLFDRMDLTESDVNLIQVTIANIANSLGLTITSVGTVSGGIALPQALQYSGCWTNS